jgi:hypothetical protein
METSNTNETGSNIERQKRVLNIILKGIEVSLSQEIDESILNEIITKIDKAKTIISDIENNGGEVNTIKQQIEELEMQLQNFVNGIEEEPNTNEDEEYEPTPTPNNSNKKSYEPDYESSHTPNNPSENSKSNYDSPDYTKVDFSKISNYDWSKITAKTVFVVFGNSVIAPIELVNWVHDKNSKLNERNQKALSILVLAGLTATTFNFALLAPIIVTFGPGTAAAFCLANGLIKGGKNLHEQLKKLSK